MNWNRPAASVCMFGFEGVEPHQSLRAFIQDGIAGAVLFKRNLVAPPQIAGLSQALKHLADAPFLLGVDQEGGRVARLRGLPFTELPPMRALGAVNDETLAEDTGRVLAREVRAVGFDIDFAPVLDVDTNPDNPVIGDRSFSRDPETVTKLGLALSRGLEAEGVASCAKHFPGHGDTAQDSHLSLPSLPHDLKRLRAVELFPFGAYARARLASVMTSHVVFEALDPRIPATFSHRALTGLLRQELGFEGLIVSDDLEMRAIADRWSIGEAAVLSVAAGVDLLLVCHRVERQAEAIETLRKEAERSAAFRARLGEAVGRVSRFAAKWARGPAGLASLDDADHRARARRIIERLTAAGPGLRDPTEASV